MMKIAHVTEYDPHDVRRWSGLGTHILHALRKGGRAEVEAWGPLPKPLFPLHKVQRLITQTRTGNQRRLPRSGALPPESPSPSPGCPSA